MKNILIISLVLFSSSWTLAQESFFSKSFIDQVYYSNLAELSICNNDVQKAARYYDTLFIISSKQSDRNIFNRALCEKLCGNYAVSDSLFTKLFISNYKIKTLSACFDTAQVSKFRTINTNNQERLQRVIEEINKRDQRAASAKYVDMERFLKTVVENSKKIMELNKNEELRSNSSFSLESSGLYFPILHFYQLWNQSALVNKYPDKFPIMNCLKGFDFEQIGFNKFLMEQTEKQNFDKYVYAYLNSLIGYEMGSIIIMQYNNYSAVARPKLLKPELLKEINNNRRLFGLESYEDYYVKVKYSDSILTSGKPFKAVQPDTNFDLIDTKDNSCNFIIADNYRFIMTFNSDKGAFSAYNKYLDKILLK